MNAKKTGAGLLLPRHHGARPPAGLHSQVAYVETPTGTVRRITLVPPPQADAGRGHISVRSPVGQALLGRTAGSYALVSLPQGGTLRIRIEHVEPEDGHASP